ncbi:MAG: hypothetical protein JST58_17150 [Bacteroidetes bacterium]|nr:hypothetical protein [Bacteroidota bacterium]
MAKKLHFIYLIFNLITLNTQAQFEYCRIRLTPSDYSNQKIDYFPFQNIILLDNRIDTSQVYTFENGQFPIEKLSFEGPAYVAIREYIQSIIAPLKKGNGTLLINIKELHIPNCGHYIKKDRKYFFGADSYFYDRDYIRFFSDIYAQIGVDRYKKIADLKLFYLWRPTTNTDGNEIKILLNGLIECASRYSELTSSPNVLLTPPPRWLKDTNAFHFSHDTSKYSIKDINTSAKERWGHFPIFSVRASNKTGIYSDFEGFKNNKLIPYRVSLIFSNKDSLYRLSAEDSSKLIKRDQPWAVCVSDSFYLRIGPNLFIDIHKKDNSFELCVPNSMPDMYTMLSIKEIKRLKYASGANSGHLLADLSSILITSTIDEIIKASAIKKIESIGKGLSLRKCFIDMDNGDIIY